MDTLSEIKKHIEEIAGKKGIGRFAVDLLGAKLTLRTKKKGDKKWIFLETDWSQYSDLEAKQLTLPFEEEKEYFTDKKIFNFHTVKI